MLFKTNKHISFPSDMMGGDHPAALYCSVWARMLAADAFSAVEEANQGCPSEQAVYDKTDVQAVTQRFRETVLANGSSLPMEQTFRAFRGRDPSYEALLVSLGLKEIDSE